MTWGRDRRDLDYGGGAGPMLVLLVGVADGLSAQECGLCARQTKGGTDVPDELTLTPTVNLRGDTCYLAKVLRECWS